MDSLLTLSQACQIMNVSYSKGQKLAKAQIIPFKKLGGTWMISRSRLFRELGMESLPNEKETANV